MNTSSRVIKGERKRDGRTPHGVSFGVLFGVRDEVQGLGELRASSLLPSHANSTGWEAGRSIPCWIKPQGAAQHLWGGRKCPLMSKIRGLA